jgi:hypothetical protein
MIWLLRESLGWVAISAACGSVAMWWLVLVPRAGVEPGDPSSTEVVGQHAVAPEPGVLQSREAELLDAEDLTGRWVSTSLEPPIEPELREYPSGEEAIPTNEFTRED